MKNKGKTGKPTKKPRIAAHFQRHIIVGILTVIPLLITWVVLDFLLGLLAGVGRPVVLWLGRTLEGTAPGLSGLLLNTAFQSVLAVVLVVAALYFLGLFAAQFIGQRLIAFVNGLMKRIPLIETIYGSVVRMIEAFQQRPDQVQRVVLIDFPSPEMKSVGLVTRTIKEAGTGRELAAVFVPTTPNPTNGYLEIVPVDKLVSLDWSMDDTISFVMSGGAVGPQNMPYEAGKNAPDGGAQ